MLRLNDDHQWSLFNPATGIKASPITDGDIAGPGVVIAQIIAKDLAKWRRLARQTLADR
jgi:hypothetical protein